MSSSPALTLHQIIDDEILITGFHDFVTRYHAEESLLFWMSVEVFRNRNWKAAKFFGMDDPAGDATTNTAPQRRGSKIASPNVVAQRIRRPSKEVLPPKKSTSTNQLQNKLDEAAAKKMGVSLEQLYLIKEADFIFDTFIRTGGEYWTCFDHKVAVNVQKQLQDPTTLTREVFAEAQAASFAEMSDDLMPRFLRELNEAGTTMPTAKAITPEIKRIKDRVALLSKAPARRKTGVSTALAFTFSMARPQKKSVEKKDGFTETERGAAVEKSATLLKTVSSYKFLNSADSLPLSRERLSNKGLRPINDSDIGPPIPRPSGLRQRPSALNAAALLGGESKRNSTPFARTSNDRKSDGAGSRPRSNSERTSGKSNAATTGPLFDDDKGGRPRSRIFATGVPGSGQTLEIGLGSSREARGLSF